MNFRWIIIGAIFIQALVGNLYAQEGMQLSGNAVVGIGMVSPQNHYDNPYYELDYKYRMGYGANVKVGYGFTDIISVVFSGGYQHFHQKYVGDFRPGLGAPPQSHEKDIKLNYVDLGLLVKFATSFQGAYVYDVKAQLVVTTGFLVRSLIGSDISYIANGTEVSYPQALIPYTNPNYLYTPVSEGNGLYTKWGLSYVINVGADIFLTDRLAFTPAIEGQLALLDINAKNYRQHKEYKASRTLFGGLTLGMTYYFNRQ